MKDDYTNLIFESENVDKKKIKSKKFFFAKDYSKINNEYLSLLENSKNKENFISEYKLIIKELYLKNKNLYIEVEKVKYPVEILQKPLNMKNFKKI